MIVPCSLLQNLQIEGFGLGALTLHVKACAVEDAWDAACQSSAGGPSSRFPSSQTLPEALNLKPLTQNPKIL